jgi:molybdopterin molybdotransferase
MSVPPPPLPWDEAQTRLLASISPLECDRRPLAEARDHYLAEDVHSVRTQPAADLSAMDGYAMRADDLDGPWRVVGESAAGHPYTGSFSRGETVRISTGAVVPADAGTILLQENAVRTGKLLVLSGTDGPTARHIRRQGFDFAAGDLLLNRGSAVTPAALALAAMGGLTTLPVHSRPRLAVIDSGDELASDLASMGSHQIPASNGSMLAALAAPLTASVRRLGPVPDRMDALLAAFEAAADCDVIVTTGGVSVGDHDLVRPALEAWGATIDFWRIALKPGKPLMVARCGAQLVLGLPGNPVSSFVTGFLFLLPTLRRMAGAALPVPGTVEQILAHPLPAVGNRTEFLRAIHDGQTVRVIEQQDSSALRSLSQASCLVLRPAGSGAATTGERVQVFPLQNGGIA